MILDRDNPSFRATGDESDDLTNLRRLLFEAAGEPTEEENLYMLARTFSSDDADLSLLPDPAVFALARRGWRVRGGDA
ncbi:hypothetical protein [Streptosporangium carneum]|uniref:Uncharacterized protein n=1 Tax=Streptosporangium carneum TaxID=47481 RepID=A0A9W6I2U1_9ACTN|nr:hypothetical protein [Streptosporangium carneum]GLK09935.1 hypothetical protein GCM10017600_33410 [Streptosporangium carneum]